MYFPYIPNKSSEINYIVKNICAAAQQTDSVALKVNKCVLKNLSSIILSYYEPNIYTQQTKCQKT